jgi:hypothetical protein
VLQFSNIGETVKFNFDLFDAMGRFVMSREIIVGDDNNEYTLYAPELPKGIYQAVISNEEYRFTERIVK